MGCEILVKRCQSFRLCRRSFWSCRRCRHRFLKPHKPRQTSTYPKPWQNPDKHRQTLTNPTNTDKPRQILTIHDKHRQTRQTLTNSDKHRQTPIHTDKPGQTPINTDKLRQTPTNTDKPGHTPTNIYINATDATGGATSRRAWGSRTKSKSYGNKPSG
jgi:hypothetical protein